MTYDYKAERPWIFTEDGQVQFLSIRDNIKNWLQQTGALTIATAIRGETAIKGGSNAG